MDMLSLAKALLILGLIFILLGGIVYVIGRSGLSLGRLPGDIRWQSGNMTCVIALGTSLFLSILLTVILNIIVRLLNR